MKYWLNNKRYFYFFLNYVVMQVATKFLNLLTVTFSKLSAQQCGHLVSGNCSKQVLHPRTYLQQSDKMTGGLDVSWQITHLKAALRDYSKAKGWFDGVVFSLQRISSSFWIIPLLNPAWIGQTAFKVFFRNRL